MFVCVWRPKIDVFSKTRSLSLNTNLAFQIECLLANPGTLLFLFPQSWDFRGRLLYPAFMWVLGIKLRSSCVSRKLLTD